MPNLVNTDEEVILTVVQLAGLLAAIRKHISEVKVSGNSGSAIETITHLGYRNAYNLIRTLDYKYSEALITFKDGGKEYLFKRKGYTFAINGKSYNELKSLFTLLKMRYYAIRENTNAQTYS